MSQARNAEGANAHVHRAMEHAIEAGGEIGLQVVAYLKGREVVNQCAGLADPAGGVAVGPDTLFNVFSVTKAITVTALHLQVERGRLDYDDPVVRYWPEYGAHGKEATTVRDIIVHRAGVPQMPEGTTPEEMCDWDLMVRRIADLKPVAPPGTRALYQSLTFGWLVGEIVRRTDPLNRGIRAFVREELGEPLGAPDLWIGVPPRVDARIAALTNASASAPFSGLTAASMPAQLSLTPEVFERPDVRRAEVAAVGGVFSAGSCARVWAMLANGGELDGVRLLSAERVATFNQPRAHSDEPDPVMFGRALAISGAGFWLGGREPPVCAAAHPRAICHPGAGNSIAWADPETGLAAAICHNRMFQPATRAEDPLLPIANAVREALGLDHDAN